MMEADPLIVQAQTKLLKRSEEVIVMADSRKLRQKSAMIVTGLDRISTIITDEGAREDELEVFRTAGIKVVVATVTEADGTAAAGVNRPSTMYPGERGSDDREE